MRKPDAAGVQHDALRDPRLDFHATPKTAGARRGHRRAQAQPGGENGRDYIGLYALAAFCRRRGGHHRAGGLDHEAAGGRIFVEQRYERAPLICGAVLIFFVRGLATYGRRSPCPRSATAWWPATRSGSSAT